MNTNRMRAIAALAAAGLAWGISVPLSKVALTWLAPGWLTFARFGLSAAILLLVVSRAALRAAFSGPVLASGALGYGVCILLQNAGIARTSVTHAALLIGAVPVLVAIIAAVWQRAVARPVAWTGFILSLAGVGLVTGSHSGGTGRTGDALVLVSVLLAATATVVQGRLLAGRDPVAVTAAQFTGAAAVALPLAAITEGVPAAPAGAGAVLAVIGLIAGGTLLPFTLFAYGQRRVAAEVAGAFLNLEPFVGAVAGVAFFGDPAGPRQLAGGVAILAGIALSGLPLLRGSRPQAGAPWSAAQAGKQVRDRVQDERLAGQAGRPGDSLEFLTGGRAGQHARYQSRAGAQARLDVARGVAGDRELADRAAAQPEQSGQRQVRPGAAAAGVGRREHQVDQVGPAERLHERVPGAGGEASRQTHLDPGAAARLKHFRRAGHRGDLAQANCRRVVRLECRVGPPRLVLVAEDVPEDLDLGLAHRGAHVLHRLVIGGHGQVARRDRCLEGGDDGAVVADGGAGHVEAGDGYPGHDRKVSSAIAGEQVMPRPPGPVTRMTPGATSDRWYSAEVPVTSL